MFYEFKLALNISSVSPPPSLRVKESIVGRKTKYETKRMKEEHSKEKKKEQFLK